MLWCTKASMLAPVPSHTTKRDATPKTVDDPQSGAWRYCGMHEIAARRLFWGCRLTASSTSSQVRASRPSTLPKETVDDPQFAASWKAEMHEIAARRLFWASRSTSPRITDSERSFLKRNPGFCSRAYGTGTTAEFQGACYEARPIAAPRSVRMRLPYRPCCSGARYLYIASSGGL